MHLGRDSSVDKKTRYGLEGRISCGRSLAGYTGSNPSESMDICVLEE